MKGFDGSQYWDYHLSIRYAVQILKRAPLKRAQNPFNQRRCIMQFYCGIDLGARKTHVCLINEDDKKLLDQKMYNDFELIEAALRPYKSSLELVAESTINWEWLVYGLQKHVYKVKLAHTL
jgi:hypothetical protein